MTVRARAAEAALYIGEPQSSSNHAPRPLPTRGRPDTVLSGPHALVFGISHRSVSTSTVVTLEAIPKQFEDRQSFGTGERVQANEQDCNSAPPYRRPSRPLRPQHTQHLLCKSSPHSRAPLFFSRSRHAFPYSPIAQTMHAHANRHVWPHSKPLALPPAASHRLRYGELASPLRILKSTPFELPPLSTLAITIALVRCVCVQEIGGAVHGHGSTLLLR